MELLIVRHGIAVEAGTPGFTEENRPLTREGEEKFREVARGLAELLPAPDTLLTSPLARAHRTAEIAAKAWGGARFEVSPKLAGRGVDEILTLFPKNDRRKLVAIFGHEPDCSELAARLLGTKHATSVAFKKGGAALLELAPDASRGVLLWFLPPKVLRKIGA
jgi:phosphohistidine phosphatase